MIDAAAAEARIRLLPPEQQSLLVMRLRDEVRRRAAAPPTLPVLADGIAVDELSDGAVEELLAQMLTADGEAAAALLGAAAKEERAPAVDEMSDDEVTAMLTRMLQEEGE